MKNPCKQVAIIMLVLASVYHANAESRWVKIRNGAEHPFVEAAKTVDDWTSVGKNADEALNSAQNAADTANASASELSASAAATLDAGKAAAQQTEQTALEAQGTIRALRLPVEIVAWNLAALIIIKVMRCLIGTQRTSAGKITL